MHQKRLADSKQERRWLDQTLHTLPVEPTQAEKEEFLLLTRLGDNPEYLRTSELGASSKVRILCEQLAKEKKRARRVQGKEEGDWLEDWWNLDGTFNWVGGVWTNPGGSNTQEEAEEDEETQDESKESEEDEESESEAEEDEEQEHKKAKEPKRVHGWAVLND